MSGDVTGSANFDGSGNVTISTSVKNMKTQVAKFTTTKNNTQLNFTFKRNMNIVWVNVELIFAAGEQSNAGVVGLDDLMPEWAKCTQSDSEMLGIEEYGEYGGSLSYTSFSSSEKHRLGFSFVRESYSEAGRGNLIFTYII